MLCLARAISDHIQFFCGPDAVDRALVNYWDFTCIFSIVAYQTVFQKKLKIDIFILFCMCGQNTGDDILK